MTDALPVEIWRAITELGGWRVLAIVVAVGALLLARRRDVTAAATLLVAWASGTLLSSGLKILIDAPRPDPSGALVEVSTASFPSGHAMHATIVWMGLAFLTTRRRTTAARASAMTAAAMLVAAIAVSRVALRVHHPIDVVAGAALGLVWLALWVVATPRLASHGPRR